MDVLYKANLDSAIAYLKVGQKGLAFDALTKALSQVPKQDIKTDNAAYFKILALLAELNISDAKQLDASFYLDRGLEIKPDHADLLFLKGILLYEQGEFDIVLVLITRFLIGIESPDAKYYDYVYNNQGAITEAMENIAINAYKNSVNKKELINIIEQLSEKSRLPLMKKLVIKLKEFDTLQGD
jgi:Tfp pilus assembly protein PilF